MVQLFLSSVFGMNVVHRDISQGIFPGTVSRYSFSFRTALGAQIAPGYIPGWGSIYLLTMIQV